MKSISRGYSLNECPSVKESIPLSIQHVLVLIFNVLPVPLLIGAGVGLSAAEITILIAGCMFVTGAATLLQTIGAGPVGAKLPIPLENSFVFVAPGIALGAQYGLNSFTGACLVGSAITCLVWIAFHKQLQILFKPYIAGAVVMSLGLSLIGVGINYCAGGVGAPDFGSPINLGLALGTILIMLLLNHYCRKNFLSKASPLIAIIIMSMAAAAAGKLDLSSVMDEAWFRLPRILHFGIKFEMGPVITVIVLAIFALVELIGDQSSAAMLAKGELPTSEETKGGVLAQGISSVAGALFNMCPTISGSANIGLCGLSGVTSRYITAMAGGVVLLCGFCPKLCALFAAIPSAVIGGVALSAFGTIVVSGMNVIKSENLTPRTTTIVGVSIAIGVGFSVVPDALALLPSWASTLFSGVPGTAIVAMVLSILLKESDN
ncbi:uracil permease [bacterium D16-54]|nr:uracil permease [bacterium D16-54]RKJ14686.1 uracil permease [bacterium D16-56]